MKAISIKQPWASLIVEGIKYVENRTWKCPEKYIGKRILIHAGTKSADFWSSPNAGIIDDYLRSISKGGTNWSDYPTGAIIGSVEIVDCVINHKSIWAEKSETNCSEKCRSKNCEHFVEWGFCRSDNECRSCKLVGQSYEVEEVPKDCPHGVKINTIYNWVLTNPIKSPKPIPAKGKLGFWESECEIIICPKCGEYCLHNNKDVGVPNWGNPVHICEHCGNMMLESEFEFLK